MPTRSVSLAEDEADESAVDAEADDEQPVSNAAVISRVDAVLIVLFMLVPSVKIKPYCSIAIRYKRTYLTMQ